MRWTPGGRSDDLEDRRGDSGGGGGFSGVHLGIGGTIIVGLLSLIFQKNFFALFSGAPSEPVSRSAPSGQVNDREEPLVQFVSFVLDDVQKTWDRTFDGYRHAKLVLFRDSYPSACGQAQSAVGPFYCPGDEKVYLDLSFFNDLKQRFGAPGEFAQAYVIAHEIGHHLQKLMGIEGKVRQLQQRSPSQANPLSVRLELQADCFAGVWGHSTAQRDIIDQGDVKAGLQAAAAVGDDRLQRMGGGQVRPESFTHGSSAQRVGWFQRGMNAGQVSACNTFNSQQ